MLLALHQAGDRFFNDPDGDTWILQNARSHVTVDGPAAGRGEHMWCRRRFACLDAGG
jgi:hypothetical protein